MNWKPFLTRRVLPLMLFLLALSAFLGAMYGLAGYHKLPVQTFNDQEFPNYEVPFAILFVVVGGIGLAAAITVIRKSLWAREMVLLSVMVTLVWIFVQLSVIGYVSWLQVATIVVACCIAALRLLLPKYNV